MQLITSEVGKMLPKLYETEGQKEKVLRLKFFTPWTYWAWYVAEYDAKERVCFGYVRGHEDEWGYFSVDELEAIRGPSGLRVERDLQFQPLKFSMLGEVNSPFLRC